MTAKVNLQPARVDLYLYREDAINLQFKIKTRDINGDIVYPDFSGSTGLAQIKLSANDTAPITSFTVTPAAAGVVTIALPTTEAAKLSTTSVWDLKITTAGIPRTWFAGFVYIALNVSRVVIP